MNNNEIYVMSDMAGTLTEKMALPIKLGKAQKNGVNVWILTDDTSESMHEYHIEYLDSVSVKVSDNFVAIDTFDISKKEKPYWPQLLKHMQLNGGQIVFIDNDKECCEKAIENNIKTIHYDDHKPQEAIQQLEEHLTALGYHPA